MDITNDSFSQQKYKSTCIGIIKLDTKFKRIIGDIGNPKTWNFPVIYYTMKDVFPDKVVNHIDSEVLMMSIKAGRYLEKQGVNAITTTCGFLAKYQSEISDSVNIPVFTSSLLQIPLIYQMLSHKKKIGILTANSNALTKEHLTGVGVRDIPLMIKGMESYHYFQKVFVRNQLVHFDRERIKAEIIDAVKDLNHSKHKLGAIVLECTNMSPFIHDIQSIVHLPIFDIYTLMQWIYSSFVETITV